MTPLRLAAILAAMLLGLSVGAYTQSAAAGPLSAAAAAGDVPSVRSILQAGTDPNTPDGPRQSRPLSQAARSAAVETMAVLVASGADPNLPDRGGNRWVPLMHAVHKRQLPSVAFLLTHGARPDGPQGLSYTPLMMAVASGQADVARLLLARGADVRHRLADGSTIVALAVSGGAFTDLDEPLLGRCHLETVRLVVESAPDLGLGRSPRAALARFFAGLNGCQQALALVDRVDVR